MNKQIKELVQRAEALTEQEWHRLAQSTDGMPAYRDLFNQMFADLIVQECVNVLQDNELWNRHISHVLKEHFGVEE